MISTGQHEDLAYLRRESLEHVARYTACWMGSELYVVLFGGFGVNFAHSVLFCLCFACAFALAFGWCHRHAALDFSEHSPDSQVSTRPSNSFVIMDSLLGFVGGDFAILAADANAARSILVFKQDEDKIVPLSKKMAMAASGAQGDRVQFSEYIQKNIVLNELRAGFPMSCVATANFVRHEIASNLRRKPYNVNCLLGGFEAAKGGCL